MQNRYGYKCGDVKPDGDIQMFFPSFNDGAKHIPAKYNPHDGDGNINRPFQFRIFFTGCKAQWQCNGGSNNDQLPSPKMYLAQCIAKHACLA